MKILITVLISLIGLLSLDAVVRGWSADCGLIGLAVTVVSGTAFILFGIDNGRFIDIDNGTIRRSKRGKRFLDIDIDMEAEQERRQKIRKDHP